MQNSTQLPMVLISSLILLFFLLSISPYLSGSLSWIKLISKESVRIEKKEEEEKKDGVVGKEKILALDIFTSHLG